MVKAILAAAKKGALKNAGVLGRLGDLCETAAEYDIAVSNASGMWDFIVVRTTAGAQRCVQFLRDNNLGRGHFLPLDKQKKGAHDRPVQTPENAPRLFDKINPLYPEIAPAIYNAVQNTLVAPDMSTASRWAYDTSTRWRVVALDGNLIEPSGAMQGGGRNVIHGKIKISVSTTLGALFICLAVPLLILTKNTRASRMENKPEQCHWTRCPRKTARSWNTRPTRPAGF